ncbi:biotin/lipoyl-binding protein, partial [Chloroflexota bacterium]
MIRTVKTILLALSLAGLTVPQIGCGSLSTEAVALQNQVAMVQRGNLVTEITAVANLALSRTEELPFDLFYGTQQGNLATVGEVLVEEGDTVKEGQTLASVDPSQWQTQLTNLEVNLATKQRDLVQKKLDLISAQTVLEDAVAQQTWPTEVFTARQQVRAAELDVEEAEAVLEGNQLVYDSSTGLYHYKGAVTTWDIKVWTQNLSNAEETLRAVQADLDKLLTEFVAGARVANAEEKLRIAQAELGRLLAESAAEAAKAAKAETEGEETVTVEKIVIDEVTLEELTTLSEAVRRSQAGKIITQQMKVELAQQELEDAQNAL